MFTKTAKPGRIERFSTIEQVAGFIIKDIPGPELQIHRILVKPAGEIQGGVHRLKKGREQFRGIPETLPITSLTVRAGSQGGQIEKVERTHVFVSSIPAGICFAVGGVDEEKIHPAPATGGLRGLAAVSVLPDKHM